MLASIAVDILASIRLFATRASWTRSGSVGAMDGKTKHDQKRGRRWPKVILFGDSLTQVYSLRL